MDAKCSFAPALACTENVKLKVRLFPECDERSDRCEIRGFETLHQRHGHRCSMDPAHFFTHRGLPKGTPMVCEWDLIGLKINRNHNFNKFPYLVRYPKKGYANISIGKAYLRNRVSAIQLGMEKER